MWSAIWLRVSIARRSLSGTGHVNKERAKVAPSSSLASKSWRSSLDKHFFRFSFHSPLPILILSPPIMVGFYCCQEKIDDSETLVCNGPSHKKPRKFHSECMNAEDIASSQNAQTLWLCYGCNPPGSQTQRVTSSANAPRTQSSSSDGWQVVEEFVGHGLQEDEYFGTETDVLKLITKWAPSKCQAQPDTPEPFFLVEVAEAEKEYFQGWQAYPGYMQKDADDLADNPFMEDLLCGPRYILERLAREVHDHSAVKKLNMGLSNVEAELFEMLQSVPVAVMHGICGAGLRSRKASDPDMYAWLVNNYIKSEGRPCIYMLELTDQWRA
jgi:hypothetical protein